MADIGKQAGEKLHGPLYTFDANEGAFSETTVYDLGGQIKSGSNYKVGTLSAALVKGDLVKIDTAADRKVKKAAANDVKTSALVGVVVDTPYGDPENGRKVLVQMLSEGDVLKLKMASGATAVAVGDGIKIVGLDADAPHGVTVGKEATSPIGYCLNSASAGEHVLVWLKAGTY